MNKGLKYLGKDNEGNVIIEEYDCQEIEVIKLDYNQMVVNFIREKYSSDDEFSINSKSMNIYLGLCSDEQKNIWTKEIKDFSVYREECKLKAKKICGI